MLSQAARKHLAAAVARLLRPVIRQLIAAGIPYPAFAEIAKRLYVQIAEEEFALPFKRQTASRLALVTGIGRKEIPQLRGRPAADTALSGVEDSVVTHVIGRWMASPPYGTGTGRARRLPYEADDPNVPSFARLVRDLTADIPVRAVLDELLRLGVVELHPDGHVELREEAHIPAVSEEGKWALLGSDPGELFGTISHNLAAPDRPWFQRKVVYDNVGAEALEEIQAEARRLGAEFMRRANALLAAYDRDRNPQAPGGPRTRVVLGAYYYEEPTEARPTPPPPAVSRPPGRIRRKRS